MDISARKIIASTIFLVIFLITNIGFCTNWVLVNEDSQGSIYVDTESIKYYGDEGDRYVSLWLKASFKVNPYYAIQFMNIRENTFNYLLYDVSIIDRRTGQIIKSYNEKNKGWQQASKGSNYEVIFTKVFAKKAKASKGGSGTGFFITPNHLLTNYHVIDGATTYEIIFRETRYTAEVFATDPTNDLAILKVVGLEGNVKPLTVASSRDVKEGSKVYTVGFPIPDLLGIRAKLSEGIINGISGFKDDMRMFQISIPIHPGNSGGPLLNNKGEVIGVITSGLGLKFLYTTGVIPQNVNYALKSSNIFNLANNYQFELPASNSPQEKDAIQIMDLCRDAVVYIEVK